MDKTAIIEWIQNSFAPLQLAVPDTTIELCVDNAISYWNTHSAYKTVEMVDYDGTSYAVEVPKKFKTVVNVLPNKMRENILSDHPMWMLLGFVTLDAHTQDLMQVSYTFEEYKRWLGANFRWKWVRSEDPEANGGYVYVQSIPEGTNAFAILGTKRVEETEDIKDEFIYRWIRDYARSLTKMYEGNVLRKADIIGVRNDGQAQVDEAKEETKDLEEKLRQEGRWLLLAKRQ